MAQQKLRNVAQQLRVGARRGSGARAGMSLTGTLGSASGARGSPRSQPRIPLPDRR
jgi:nicotinamide mononucleotide (NMN) deamidase PncC